MSTNIEVDVVLQRLQVQSNELRDLNRNGRLDREDQQLQAVALRSALLQQQIAGGFQAPGTRTKLELLNPKLQAELSKVARPLSSYQEKRPGAQRTASPGMAAAESVFNGLNLIVGPPGLAASVSQPLPRSTLTSNSNLNRRINVTFDKTLLLPVTKDACILVYLRNFLDQVTRIDLVTTMLNSYQTTYLGISGTMVTFREDYVQTAKDKESAYELYCFIVGKETVRQLTTPETLATHLREIYKPLSVNGTQQGLDYTVYDVFYPSSPSYPPRVVTFQPFYRADDSFSVLTWEASGRYGAAMSMYNTNAALSQQFGLLDANTGNTPAIYRYLRGPMQFSTSSRDYAYMRQTYYAMAPRYFLQQCVLPSTCSAQKVGFDVTTTQPAQWGDSVESNAFKANDNYDVQLNGSGQSPTSGTVRYAWHWDNPSYCRQQLQALGFIPSDLRP